MTLQSPPPPPLLQLNTTYKQESLLLTPERSVPSSPTLSSAVVTHTNATTKHLHTNDDSVAVDFNELTRLLHNVACSSSSSSKKKNKNETSSSSSASSSTSTSTTISHQSTSSNTNSGRRRSSCLNPNPANTPPQFVFKKPLYNQYYHQTHFHHSSNSLLTPTQTNHSNTPQQWIDLKRFFNPTTNNSSSIQHQLVIEEPFANGFRQNISSRYGQWGR